MLKLIKILIPAFLIFILNPALFSQQQFKIITGRISDSTGKAIPLTNIAVSGRPDGTFSDNNGLFFLSTVADRSEQVLVISSIGYVTKEVPFLATIDTMHLNIKMEIDIKVLHEVIVRDEGLREAPSMFRIPIKDISFIPVTTGAIESVLKSMPGVNSPNELSNQYLVRGGNYDENLVYVNDIEIYRPLLIKSGRQEGLSFINQDLTGSVTFSTGGFNASYGDKMSSVLDIKYREPDQFRGSVRAGLLTSSVHAEGISKGKKFSFITGARYMTNRFLLKTLDTRANYTPAFYDLQTLMSLITGDKSVLKLLVTYSYNRYRFVPISQRSSFGNFKEAYQLYVAYNGSETDSYQTTNSALSWEWNPAGNFENRFIIQYFNTSETETYDIRGHYSLNLLDKNLGSENMGDSIMNIGIGSWLDHARNSLKGEIISLSFKSRWEHANNVLSWGLKLNNEHITDNINEWRRLDSAGYTVPYSQEELLLTKWINTNNNTYSRRFEGYLIDNYQVTVNDNSLILTGGARVTYWSFNNELLFSPRISVRWIDQEDKLSVYFSTGTYYQPPFYREMRFPDGTINKNIKSQKSIHYVLGSSWNLIIGTTPFRLTAEAYYKRLNNLIPYKFDNVRIIYSGENSAEGRVKGLDLRIHGEFVRDAESWVSVSIMDARHNILDDNYPEYPAPTDIRFSTNIFFQDYFPSDPSYKAHINIHFSTGMPVSSPYEDRYDNYYRMPPYRRVDIGFTKVLKDKMAHIGKDNRFSFFESIIIGMEIFNLIDINNTISYHWLTTVNNLNGESRQFAVPNYLTGRSLNLRVTATF